MKIVSGLYKNRKLQAPKSTDIRPTSSRLREALFNICQPYIEGASFLDLFAGTGAMGFEALSRGASRVTFVDSSKESIQCIKKNLQALEAEGNVCFGDVFVLMKKLKTSYDIIFADPPYEAKGHFRGKKIPFSQRVVELIDQGEVLKTGGMLFIEDAEHTLDEELPLATLTLLSSRRVGRSELKQYKKI